LFLSVRINDESSEVSFIQVAAVIFSSKLLDKKFIEKEGITQLHENV
jgi:hypothetical protein